MYGLTLICTPACPVIQRAGIKLPSPREHSGRNSKWELPRKRGQCEQVAGECGNVPNYVYLLTHFKIFFLPKPMALGLAF